MLLVLAAVGCCFCFGIVVVACWTAVECGEKGKEFHIGLSKNNNKKYNNNNNNNNNNMRRKENYQKNIYKAFNKRYFLWNSIMERNH